MTYVIVPAGLLITLLVWLNLSVRRHNRRMTQEEREALEAEWKLERNCW